MATLSVLAGCLASVDVGRQVALPPIPKPEMLPVPIALYLEETLKTHVETSRLSTPHGARKTYEFKVGEALAPALAAQMRSIFTRVDDSQVLPTQQSLRDANLAGVMWIGLKHTAIDIHFVPDLLGSEAKTSYQIALEVAFQDNTGNEIFRRRVTGVGTSSRRTSGFDDSAFVPGIDLAIQSVLERLSEAIISAPLLGEVARRTPIGNRPNLVQPVALTAMQESPRSPPPLITIASPSEGQQVGTEWVHLIGATASDTGIARMEVRVNGEPLARRAPRGGEPSGNLEFSERLRLQEGPNEIGVTVFDRENRSTTRTVSVMRIVERGTIWGVIVGISRYKAVRPLLYGAADAVAFYDYLLHQVGVPKENLTLLTDDQATLVNLKRTLGTELKRKAGQKDTVIIYFAGHGAPEIDSTSPDEDGLEKYLIPYDADPHDLYTTALPIRDIESIFQRLASERVIFIADACYSGAAGGRTFTTVSRRAVMSDAFLDRLARGKGRIVMTASKANEVSVELDSLGHGVFTYYLLEGLRGKADLDGDGLITADEIYAYVSKKVPEATGQNQNPVKKGDVEGQFVLGRVPGI